MISCSCKTCKTCLHREWDRQRIRRSGIYTIINAKTGERYIGSSSDLANRFGKHKALLNRKLHTSKLLQTAWDQHGTAAFVFHELELVEEKRLLERERFWIETTKPTYNILLSNWTGHKHKNESRQKMREAKLGTTASDETKQKMSLARIGRTHSAETRARITAGKLAGAAKRREDKA